MKAIFFGFILLISLLGMFGCADQESDEQPTEHDIPVADHEVPVVNHDVLGNKYPWVE